MESHDTGALRLMRTLHSRGVSICFANPGTTEMWLVSAMDSLAREQDVDQPKTGVNDRSSGGSRQLASPPEDAQSTATATSRQTVGGIRAVLGLHETVCTGAADGYARMARAPATVLLHLGPGLANGLANLHNARRARSPVLCLIGDMASWHASADPLLSMDIPALARTVSRAVALPRIPSTSSTQQQGNNTTTAGPCADWATTLPPAVWHALAGQWSAVAGSKAERETSGPWQVEAGVSDSRVVSLVVPHDLSWEVSGAGGTAGSSSGPLGGMAAQLPEVAAAGAAGAGCVQGPLDAATGQLTPAARQFVRECAAAIGSTRRGRVALYLGGEALLAQGGALVSAGLCAAGSGAALLCENAFARLDRGAGLPAPRRLPYFPQEAAQELSTFELLVVVDTRLPVANFGYLGGPSALVPQPLIERDAVWELDTAGQPGAAAALLAALVQELGVGPGCDKAVTPGVNCGGLFPTVVSRPVMPPADTRLSPSAICTVVSALQPEGCVLVDESLTSGGPYWDLSKGSPRFSHLTLTGGAIGSGPPLALGAALAAAPGTVVINLQADGSAMYSLQALWSQAREAVHVITIICSNRSYAILKVECARQRLPAPGPVTRALTDLSTPPISWVSLADGLGVRASQANTVGELAQQLMDALAHDCGPSLIEAVL